MGRQPVVGRAAVHGRGGAILLTATSSLLSGFRFGLDRHKSATGVHGSRALHPPPGACQRVEQGM